MGTALAHACQIERRLSAILDAPASSANLPKDRVNILLVVARPYGDEDVRYRSIARSLVEMIGEREVVPTHVSVSDGELARQALTVLGEDPATRVAIDSMAGEAGSGGRHRFDVGGTMALGFAAYFALSTAIGIQRDKDGKWSFKMKVRPASEAAVKKLVEKLIGYLPG